MAFRTLIDMTVGTPNNSKHYIEGACLAADTKPTTDIAMGSKVVEIDTGDVYLFNETSWVKQFSLQG